MNLYMESGGSDPIMLRLHWAASWIKHPPYLSHLCIAFLKKKKKPMQDYTKNACIINILIIEESSHM